MPPTNTCEIHTMVPTAHRDVDYSNLLLTSHFDGKYYDCKFNGAKTKSTVVLSGYFYNCKFIRTVFAGALLRSCTFVSCNFTEADFSDSEMNSPKFEACCLDRTKFEGTQGIWTASLDALCSIDRAIGVKAVTSERGRRMLIRSSTATLIVSKQKAARSVEEHSELGRLANLVRSFGSYYNDELEWVPVESKKPAKLLSSKIAELRKK